MPSRPGAKSRLDSWPPTLVRLSPTTPKDYPRLDDIDDDPLTYFLTPAPDLEDDADAAMMDFDAGIESPGTRADDVRSVSPSSLDGLARPIPRARRARSPPVPELSDIATPESEDEAYIRFASFGGGRASARPALKQGPRLTAEALLSASAAASGPRGRSRASASGRGRQQQQQQASAARRRGNQTWREPSPDVWSIEEETEEEMLSEMGSSVAARSEAGEATEAKVARGKGAKTRKRVRFVLPAEEM